MPCFRLASASVWLGGALSVFFLSAADASFRAFSPDGNGPTHPPGADGRTTEVPHVEGFRLSGESIRMDGRLDDAAWQNAECGRGFRVWDPNRGTNPSEETVFKVAYDDKAVYFGVACLERDPSRISSNLSRRDRFSNSDLVSVYIDPYHDHTTGYNFKVNPVGVLMDAYVYDDGDQDQNWDAVWQAETYRDAEGWYVEMRIPFSSIRYRSGPEMTWGLQVYRYMHGRGEDTAWVTWSRENRGFVSRFGELRGLRDVSAPRQIEILPYYVQRLTDPKVEGAGDDIENFQDAGADFKYGVTADLTLNATIQPDFGQVEADPAVLNLSPFETFFEEKRPFFVEGSRFFQHPSFNLFYSRRIGTGNDNARIRLAGKLTGKTAGDVSVAALLAATDVTAHGQAHNVFKGGTEDQYYLVGRLGKEFHHGNYRVNLMQTAALKNSERDLVGDAGSREAYTTGLDFELNFRNRAYAVRGSWVGSVLDPETSAADPAVMAVKQYGTGGNLELGKFGGSTRTSVFGRWESDELELNDMGYLGAPDEITSGAWVGQQLGAGGKSRLLNQGEINLNVWKSWLYAGREGFDDDTGARVWSYGPGHRQNSGGSANSWLQFRSYWEGWAGVEVMPEGTQRYETRGGPLMSEPTTWGVWLGGQTDYRKRIGLSAEGSHYRDVEQNHSTRVTLSLRWNASSTINNQLKLTFRNRLDDTQYLETVDLTERPGGVGLGGLSYVFGDIHEQSLDLTLRTSILFTRTQSLEIYAQPYIDVGTYRRVRELAGPDSYALLPYAERGYRPEDQDFSYTSVNLNVIYRWEYRPGSTFYVVWTQGREATDTRSSSAGRRFDPGLGGARPFATEPENSILVKVSYWFSL